MKKKIASLLLVLIMCAVLLPTSAFAAYSPPTSYGAPTNVGVVFENDFELDSEGRWNFAIGYGAPSDIRALITAYEDGSLEEAGYSSLDVSAQVDYKIDNGAWRSSKGDYADWVKDSNTYFEAGTGTWMSDYILSDYEFEDVFAGGILPGAASYFDSHSMTFRLRFFVSFYDETTGEERVYYSPWSAEVSYSNNQKVEDPAALIDHAPTLISVEMTKDADGRPYVDFQASKAHDDVQKLNNISGQRVFTNVWVRLDGGEWYDAGEWCDKSFHYTRRRLGAVRRASGRRFQVIHPVKPLCCHGKYLAF